MKIINENSKMGISSYGRKIGNASRNDSRAENKSGSAGHSETVAISSQARQLKEASSAIRLVPEMREDKIAPVKDQIENGTYQVDSKKIAEKIILDILETRSIK